MIHVLLLLFLQVLTYCYLVIILLIYYNILYDVFQNDILKFLKIYEAQEHLIHMEGQVV